MCAVGRSTAKNQPSNADSRSAGIAYLLPRALAEAFDGRPGGELAGRSGWWRSCAWHTPQDT
jgi:hypothetical protein